MGDGPPVRAIMSLGPHSGKSAGGNEHTLGHYFRRTAVFSHGVKTTENVK
jgi:hypothetical protein